MEKLKKFGQWSLDNVGNIISYFGWAVSFSIPAWFGHLTEWVLAYGPIGWVVCGFAGLLAFVLIAAIWAFAREKIVSTTIARNFYQTSDRIDPMKSHFLNQRLNLEDFLPPGTGFVEGKTFEGCELIGPLNILTFDTIVTACTFEVVDHIMIDIEKALNIRNARIFKDCTFKKCKFFHVSFLIAESAYENVTMQGGTNWITPTPMTKIQNSIPESDSEKVELKK